MTSLRIMGGTSALILLAAVLGASGVVDYRIERDAVIAGVDDDGLHGEYTPVPEFSPVDLDPEVCSIVDRIAEAQTMLSDVTLDVGRAEIEYWEVRNGTKKIFSDYEKEFALVVLHRGRCQLELVTITKHGDELIAPDGWHIEPVKRANGIRWNNWNTEFRVFEPEDAVVVANVEPFVLAERPGQRVTSSEGDTRTVYTTSRAIEYRPYAPYSRDVHTSEMVDAGEEYLADLVARAFAELREQNVRSRAFPERLVVELPYLDQAMFARLPIIEHMDLLEFILEPERVSERVMVLLAGNQGDAFTFTCSHAGACGLMQYTDANGNGTYSTIRRRYPDARIEPDFEKGAKDHLNAMKAAILLHDNNLAYLIGIFGEEIVRDARLEEYLAALYNASPGSVVPAIDAGRNADGDWTDYFPSGIERETGGYIVKLRYLQEDGQFADAH